LSGEYIFNLSTFFSNYFNVPPARIVVTNRMPKPNVLGAYSLPDKTIYIRSDVAEDPNLLAKVLAHEYAHYVADEKGLEFSSLRSEEDFANAIEDWISSGASSRVCEVCGHSVPLIKGYSRCYYCGVEYQIRLM
jgi:predicted Zn-dependent protease